MTQSYNLTNTFIDKVSIPEKGDCVYNDNKVHGLQLRVLATGIKSFRIFKIISKKRITHTLGKYPEIKIELARQKAIEYLSNIHEHLEAKISSQKNGVITLVELYQKYKTLILQKRKDSYVKEVDYMYNKYISQWDKITIPIMEISKSDLYKFLETPEFDFATKTRTSDKVSRLIMTIINNGVNYDLIPHNPIAGKIIKSYTNVERERVLTSKEIDKLIPAIKTELNPYSKLFFYMLLCVPTRLTNTLEMRWDAIDFDDQVWTINGIYTKNNKTHYVPLTKRALVLLNKLSQLRINDYVFPSLKLPNKPTQNVTKSWDKIRNMTDLKDVVLHDFRRTQSTFMSRAGANEFTIAKALDHMSSMRITAIYVRPDNSDILNALEKCQDLMFKDYYFDDL